MRPAVEAAPSKRPVDQRPPALDPDAAELQKRLLWLAAFRIGAVTVLVGTTAILTFKGGEPLGGRITVLLSALAAGTNLLQIGVVLLLRLRRWLWILAFAQIVGDVIFATSLVYLTGGGDSLFSFMYVLAIVNGGILLAARGAWLAAGSALLAHSTLVITLQQGLLRPVEEALGQTRLGLEALVQMLFTHGTAFALTAVLGTYVAGQLRRQGERAQVAESTLLKLSVLHDSIVRSIASGILTTSEDGRVTFLNRAGEEILERKRGDAEGLLLADLLPGLASVLAEAAPAPGIQRLELAWQGEDGAQRFLGFTITPLFDDHGKRLGDAAVFQDLTRYRELELRAARSERLAAVGQLAAGLAHELRNPLASMSGSVELLASAPGQSAEDRRLFEILLREAERLNGLVTDFLAFARPAPPSLTATSLPVLVNEVLAVFGADPQVAALARHTALSPASARADASQVKQVLWNLLVNAAEASQGAPEAAVTVTTGRGPDPGQVFVRVEDRGRGMSPEEHQRIFNPFYTTKEHGTGLGLATVHRIVDAHGGHVVVGSEPGKGARFTVILPEAEG